MTAIPVQFRAGDRVTWTETGAPEDATAVTAYLRTNAAEGLTVSAVEGADGWTFTIPGATTAPLAPGDWQAQVVATVDSDSETVRVSSFTLLPSLTYSGSATAIDLRSDAQKQLDLVNEAINAILGGAQEYYIGTGFTTSGGRRVRRADLPALWEVRRNLMAQVAAEKRAEAAANGRNAERHVFVNFTTP